MAQTQSETKLRGLRDVFDGLSFSQVTAGALAAATSMLLASNVGIAGTVIGVAVSSVVSAVASQVYKKFLIVSAEKVKDLAPTSLSPHSVSLGGLMPKENGAGRDSQNLSEDSEAADAPSAETVLIDGRVSANGESVFGGLSRAEARRGQDVSMGEAYADAALLKARIARERKARIQRNTIIVAVLSAVIAVVVCALTIDVATQGKGLGPQMPTATYIQARNAATSEEEEAVVQEEETNKPSQDAESSNEEEGISDANQNEEERVENAAPIAPEGTTSSGGNKTEAPDESGGAVDSEESVPPSDSEDASNQSSGTSTGTNSAGSGAPGSGSASHSGASSANGAPSASAQVSG